MGITWNYLIREIERNQYGKKDLSTENSPPLACTWFSNTYGNCRRARSIEASPLEGSPQVDRKHEQPCKADPLVDCIETAIRRNSYPTCDIKDTEQTGSWVKRSFRITRSTDFKRVRRTGRSHAHPLVVLVTAPNEEEKIRIGVVAGQRVGGAVQRNRAKRRIRAVVHAFIPRMKPGWDLIFIARQPISEAQFEKNEEALASLIKRAGMFRTESNGNASGPRLSE